MIIREMEFINGALSVKDAGAAKTTHVAIRAGEAVGWSG